MTTTDGRVAAEPGIRSLASPRTPGARAWLRAHGPRLADRIGAPAVVWLLTFPNFPRAPLEGLDGSYRSGLQLAFARHFQYGVDLVYSFGPLGFLAVPDGYFGRGTLLAIAAYAGARLALVVITYRLVRRVLAPIWAAAVTYVFISLLGVMTTPRLSDTLFALLGLSCVVLVTSKPPTGRRWYAVIAGLGVLASTLVLLKLNNGVFGVVVSACSVFVVGLQQRWTAKRVLLDIGALSATFVGFTLVFWMLTGQELVNLGTYFRRWGAVTTDYVGGMAIEAPGHRWEYAAALVVTTAIGYVTWQTWKRSSTAKRATIVLPVGILLVAILKEGFVRHDAEHASVFFASAAVLVLGFINRRNVAAVATVVALSLAVGLIAPGADVLSLVNPRGHVDGLRDQVELAVSKSARVERRDRGREGRVADYALTPQTLAALDGHTVHASPWEASVFAAYPTLDWDPLPVFQENVAYDDSLDDLNRSFLESTKAPEMILRHVVSIDGRNPGWESPDAMLAMACNYRLEIAQPYWFVLRRGSQRCGSSHPLSQVRARIGEAVPLPSARRCPGILTFSVDGLGDSFAERVRTLVFKPPSYYVAFHGAGRYRFVPGTAGGRHLLHVPGNPIWVMGEPDLGSARSMTFERDGIGLAATGAVDVTFSCVPYRAPAVSAP